MIVAVTILAALLAISVLLNVVLAVALRAHTAVGSDVVRSAARLAISDVNAPRPWPPRRGDA